MNTGRTAPAGTGTQTAGLGFGGYTTIKSNATEEYNGTSWTNKTNMAEGRSQVSGAGTQTSALCSGGFGSSTYSPSVEEYTGDIAATTKTVTAS